MYALIYKMEFSNGAFYIGASRNYKERKRTHMRHMRRGEFVNKLVGAEYARCGAPTFTIVAMCLQVSELHILETAVMDSFGATLNVVKPTPLPSSDKLPCRPFGPHPSLVAAALALGLTYRQLKFFSRKFSYDQLLVGAHKRPPKKCRAVGEAHWHTRVTRHPPDPRKDIRLAHKDGRWDFKGKFVKEKKMPMPKRVINVLGVEMDLDAAAEIYRVRKGLITQRLCSGWTAAEAVGAEPSPKGKATEANARAMEAKKLRASKHTVVYHGEHIRLSALCERLDVGCTTVKRQLDKGACVEDAVMYAARARADVKNRRAYWQRLDEHYRNMRAKE